MKMSIINKIEENHIIIEEFDGKIIEKICRFKGQEKNKYWLVQNKETNEEYYVMDISNDRFTYIDKESIDRVLSFDRSWTVSHGYVICEYERNKKISMHAFLMNYSGHGLEKGALTVDHINRNKFDNRLSNLRLATQAEQNQNTGKRERKYNAKPLPDGIQQKDLPKYVTYNAEYEKEPDENGNKILKRDFFRIEKHPKQNGKSWSSSKSKFMSIQEKLQQSIEQLAILDGV